MSDRQQILQRRARLISSALVALAGCGRQGEGPTAATPQDAVAVPPASAEATSSASTSQPVSPRPAAVRLPPLTQPRPPADPPQTSGIAASVASDHRSLLARTDQHLTGLESGFDVACSGDCKEKLLALADALRRIDSDLHDLASPLCPPSSDEGQAVMDWTLQHVAYHDERVRRLDNAAVELARRRNLASVWSEARHPKGGPMAVSCLSCARW